MSAPKIRIYLKHYNKPELNPRAGSCQDYEDPRTGQPMKGCGGSVIRYTTYPKGKGIRFDGEPVVIPGTEARLDDGGIVAEVETANVHFATCTARKRAEPSPTDFRSAAAGR